LDYSYLHILVLSSHRFSITLDPIISCTCISVTQIHLNMGHDYSCIPDIDITYPQYTNHLDPKHNTLFLYKPLFFWHDVTAMYDCLCHCIKFSDFRTYYLILRAWTTSLDHVHVCLLVQATWLHFTYSLNYFLTTVNLHVQILKHSGSVVESFSGNLVWSEN